MYTFNVNNAQTIAARIFQLTEWVYKVIVEAVPTTNIAPAEVVRTYNKCLNWYSGIMGILNASKGRTPFALFIQYVLGPTC